MLMINLLGILGLCSLINAPPVGKSWLFPQSAFRPLGIRNSTETNAETPAEPLVSELYEYPEILGDPYTTRSSVGLRLFGYRRQRPTEMDKRPSASTATSRRSFPRTSAARRKNMKYWPNEEEGRAGEARAKAPIVGRRYPGAYPTELTLRVPYMSRNPHEGNWVYNPWGVTFGQRFMDTRFAGRRMGEDVAKLRVDLKPVFKYNPTAQVDSVCRGRSTIYNFPNVRFWLKRLVHNVSFDRRTIWLDLRREIHEQARAEECHTRKFSNFQLYQECALRRNQRMEYMIPQYPLHQIGYRKFYSVNLEMDDDLMNTW